MKCRLKYLPALLLCLLLFSCNRGGRVIPRGQMSQIYAEMFLLDQRISGDFTLRRIADTTRVYEAVLAEHGYTLEDYALSQEHYIRDARHYTKMLKKSVEIVHKEGLALKAAKSIEDAAFAARRGVKRFAPHRICLLDTLTYSDSLFNFDFQAGLDTVFAGPRIVVAADTAVVDKPDTVVVDKPDTVVVDKPAADVAVTSKLKNRAALR